MDPVIVEQRTQLPVSAQAVWERATTAEGIRHELRPFLSMTMPPGLRGKSIADAGSLLGQPLGKAWLLLFGVVPVDYDDMRLVSIEAGRSFHESSTMLTLSRWEHERTITALDDESCEVHDRLTALPRMGAGLPVVRRVVAGLVGALFRHRHRRLTAWAQSSGSD